MTPEEIKKRDSWDVTLNQLVNGMFEVENYIVQDARYEDDSCEPEFTFSSKYKARVFLHPKYAFAKVAHCELVDANTLKVYVKLDEEVEA